MSIPSGIVLIDKPPGITSFQALSSIKKQLNTGKVGHAGTLDKFASGLLVVCTGKFTKLTSYITNQDKEYKARFRFGEETETLDPEGAVKRRMPVPGIEDITRALDRFTGTMIQKPPAFSAVHIGGKRAYHLARQGKEVDIPGRNITVYGIEVSDWQPPDLSCTITCSKGTYIRSLARDIGSEAGSCAYTAQLRRTRIGSYTVDSAVPPDHFQCARDLMTTKKCFECLPMIGTAEIRNTYTRHISEGRQLEASCFKAPPENEGLLAVCDESGDFLALVEKKKDKFRYVFVMSGL